MNCSRFIDITQAQHRTVSAQRVLVILPEIRKATREVSTAYLTTDPLHTSLHQVAVVVARVHRSSRHSANTNRTLYERDTSSKVVWTVNSFEDSVYCLNRTRKPYPRLCAFLRSGKLTLIVDAN
jgi:hypothetical protein